MCNIPRTQTKTPCIHHPFRGRGDASDPRGSTVTRVTHSTLAGGKSYAPSLVSPSSGVTRRTQSPKTYLRSIRDVRCAPAARAPRRPLSLLALSHSNISKRTTYSVSARRTRQDGIVRTRSKHPRPRVLSTARVAHPAASRPRHDMYIWPRSSRRGSFLSGIVI